MNWLKSLDQILRGEVTRPESVDERGIDIPLFGVGFLLVLMAMVYGACMGSFSLFKEAPIEDQDGRYFQVLASTLKVPALYLLTLIVTFPSLYVFNALVGSRLHLPTLLRLLVASLAVNLAVLASMGPITAFFSISTTSYPFMKLFNVAVFGIAGVLGLAFLVQTLNRLTIAMGQDEKGERAVVTTADTQPAEPVGQIEAATETKEPGSDASQSLMREQAARSLADVDADAEHAAELVTAEQQTPLGALGSPTGHVLGRHVRTVFRIWIVVFGLVGAQMGWVLRPFIGNPDQAFTWLRARESNIFLAILESIGKLLGG